MNHDGGTGFNSTVVVRSVFICTISNTADASIENDGTGSAAAGGGGTRGPFFSNAPQKLTTQSRYDSKFRLFG